MRDRRIIHGSRPLVYSVLTILALFAGSIIAGPANQEPFDAVQPDGRTITIQVTGDEFYHSFETVEGYTILQDSRKWWAYALRSKDGNLVASSITVTPTTSRSARELEFLKSTTPHLKPSDNVKKEIFNMRMQFNKQLKTIHETNSFMRERSTEWKLCVLLVEFKDVAPIISAQAFKDEFNKPGFDDGIGGPGCMNDYMKEASYNKFCVVADVFGWYKDTQIASYYAHGGPDPWGRSRELFQRTATTADPEVDFTKYDNNKDSEVECVIVIHSGRGASEDGNTAYVWNHMFWLGSTLTKDGVRLKNYTLDNELEYGHQAGLGNLVHEFGHALGLPDLYGTPSVGNWCVMGTGAWCNGGKTPSHYCAFQKKKLGWSVPQQITTNGVYTLKQVATDNSIFYCKTTKTTEYFLLENRQKVGWDKYVPGSGIILYHVDATKDLALYNFGGGTASPAVIEEAHGGSSNIGSNRGDAGDPFPGTSNKTVFNATSSPNNLLLNSSVSSGVTLANISSSGASMTAMIAVPGGETAITDGLALSGKSGISITVNSLRKTVIGFYAPTEGKALLRVVDMSGKTVRTLANGTLSAGHHEFVMDGTGKLGAGLYLFHLTMGEIRICRKVSLAN